jgi:hypothetical protein
MNCSFFVADTLGMDLLVGTNPDGSTLVWGNGRKPIYFKGWELSLSIQAKSHKADQYTAVGMWVSFTETLWAYLHTTVNVTTLSFFNAQDIGMTMNNTEDFFPEIVSNHFKGTYKYTQERWERVAA